MASLYELGAEYTALLNAYDSAATDEEAEEILQALFDTQRNIQDKAEVYAKIIRMKEEEAKGFKAEADRLTARKQAAENMANRLKMAMLDAMRLTDTQEIKTSIGKWRVQMNPWSCEVVDIDKVPMEYHIKQEDKIDKKGLLAKFKTDGEIIDGVNFTQEQGIRFR